MHQNPAVELSNTDVPIGVTADWHAHLGRLLIAGSSIVVAVLIVIQIAKALGVSSVGFSNWRPVAVGILAWAVCLMAGLVLARGQRGQELVFLCPPF